MTLEQDINELLKTLVDLKDYKGLLNLIQKNLKCMFIETVFFSTSEFLRYLNYRLFNIIDEIPDIYSIGICFPELNQFLDTQEPKVDIITSDGLNISIKKTLKILKRKCLENLGRTPQEKESTESSISTDIDFLNYKILNHHGLIQIPEYMLMNFQVYYENFQAVNSMLILKNEFITSSQEKHYLGIMVIFLNIKIIGIFSKEMRIFKSFLRKTVFR